MSKGGGGGGKQTSTVYQSSLPQYAQPFYESLMERGQAESYRPYQPYEGQRLAGQSANTTRGLEMASAYANSGSDYGLDPARSLYGTTAENAIDLQNYVAGGVDPTYAGPERYATSTVGFGQNDIDKLTSTEFDAAQRDKYMSPYMSAVTESAQADAQLKALQEQAYLGGEAAKAGAFGGSRGGVRSQMALSDAQKRIADIGVQGRQAAFENAQQQFERDQQRAAQASQGNLQAALDMAREREQSRQFGAQTWEQGEQEAARQYMSAQEATERLRQGGKELGLQGLQIANQSAQGLAGLESQHEEMMLNRIKAQLGIGQTQEDYLQQQLDQGYQDFVNQRDAGRQNLQFISSLLQGVPISANQDVTTSQQGNDLAGMLGGVTGLQALYNLGRGQQ